MTSAEKPDKNKWRWWCQKEKIFIDKSFSKGMDILKLFVTEIIIENLNCFAALSLWISGNLFIQCSILWVCLTILWFWWNKIVSPLLLIQNTPKSSLPDLFFWQGSSAAPFSTSVPLMDKPGSWLLLAKCLKNTCERVTF